MMELNCQGGSGKKLHFHARILRIPKFLFLMNRQHRWMPKQRTKYLIILLKYQTAKLEL